MTYELAKQLKDAGFPQTKHPCVCHAEGEHTFFSSKKHGEYAYHPSLSELVEACGESFHLLRRDGSTMWTAQNSDTGSLIDKKNKRKFSIANSPEEAIAKLWLELNKVKI